MLHDTSHIIRHCRSQIFQEERHPSAMGIGSSKEGFSVFGSLNCCVSPVGRRLLRTWFLRPIIDLKVWRHACSARIPLHTCIKVCKAILMAATSTKTACFLCVHQPLMRASMLCRVQHLQMFSKPCCRLSVHDRTASISSCKTMKLSECCAKSCAPTYPALLHTTCSLAVAGNMCHWSCVCMQTTSAGCWTCAGCYSSRSTMPVGAICSSRR